MPFLPPRLPPPQGDHDLPATPPCRAIPRTATPRTPLLYRSFIVSESMTFGRSPPGRRTPGPTGSGVSAVQHATRRRCWRPRLWSHPRWMAGWPRKTRACALKTALFVSFFRRWHSKGPQKRVRRVGSDHSERSGAVMHMGSDLSLDTIDIERSRYPLGSAAGLRHRPQALSGSLRLWCVYVCTVDCPPTTAH